MISFSHAAVAQVATYACYTDCDVFYGFDAVRAHIEVVPTTLTYGLSVWCGIDDNAQTLWVQAGWRRYQNYSSAQAYYEYFPEAGAAEYTLIELGAAPTAVYDVVHSGAYINIYVNGQLQVQVPWSKFDVRLLKKAQYCAELHGYPGDHVPGTVSQPCDFSSVQNRSLGFGYLPASLSASHFPANGGTAAGGGFFSLWDTRDP